MFEAAYLLLADGSRYEGKAIGLPAVTTGQLCFNTAMTGYQEVYSDPSYYGQILISTVAHVGNYGVIPKEDEAEGPQVRGIVIRHYSPHYSRASAKESLHSYLLRHRCTGIVGVDTRALVRHLVREGAQNALICANDEPLERLQQKLSETPSIEGLDFSMHVTTPKAYAFGPDTPKVKVAVLDFGIKRAILRQLAARGIGGMVFPANTTFETLSAYPADGYFLSNGPGDPAAMDKVVPVIEELVATGRPLFGICLGHQLLARACGLKTHKLHFGHRGINHPILDKRTKQAFISTQNHGFVVDQASVAACQTLDVTHVHLNDGTVAGIHLQNKPIFSVQFHPEASAGPQDGEYLFDKFADYLSAVRKEKTYVSYS